MGRPSEAAHPMETSALSLRVLPKRSLVSVQAPCSDRGGPPWVVRGRCKCVGRPRAGRLKRLLPRKHLHCPFEVTLEAMWGDTWRTDVMRPDI